MGFVSNLTSVCLVFYFCLARVIIIQLHSNSESPPVWERAADTVCHILFVCWRHFVLWLLFLVILFAGFGIWLYQFLILALFNFTLILFWLLIQYYNCSGVTFFRHTDTLSCFELVMLLSIYLCSLLLFRAMYDQTKGEDLSHSKTPVVCDVEQKELVIMWLVVVVVLSFFFFFFPLVGIGVLQSLIVFPEFTAIVFKVF